VVDLGIGSANAGSAQSSNGLTGPGGFIALSWCDVGFSEVCSGGCDIIEKLA
jgi:hypothetical protein